MNDDLPRLGEDGRILEGLATTLNADGAVNIAPMGPIVDAALTTLVFRPFRTSTTYQNLKRTGAGVFHVTDDVRLLARAAVGELNPLPELVPAQKVAGMVLLNACRWVELEVASIEDRDERATIVARTVAEGSHREFFGLNRAQAAVVEAAILATRVRILPREDILAELSRLEMPLKKTGGRDELEAFTFLRGYVDAHAGEPQRT